MNAPSNAQSGAVAGSVGPQAAVRVEFPLSRIFYWLMRRELWEYRSLYIAPLAVAVVTLFGFLIATLGRALSTSDLGQRRAILEEPYTFAALLIMGTTFVVAIFYCLEALHSERRDRSILFWKSLPLSDTTTVLAKASVPVIVLPLITFAITIAMQWIMVLLDSAVMMASGLSAASLWAHSPVFATWMPLLYHLLAIHGLWFAPIYGWLLLISAWAKRLAFLWAFLPFVAIGAIEKLAFNTTHFAGMLGELLGGGPDSGALTGGGPMHPLSHNIGQLVVSPGLWIGLTFTAACLAGAVWLRRSQRPI